MNNNFMRIPAKGILGLLLNKLILLMLLLPSGNLYGQPFSIASTPDHSGGAYAIYRTASNSLITIAGLRKAVIWVEGFDALNETGIEANYGIINQGSLATMLHNAGYDIIVLNFNHGGDYIQRNARVLQQLIADVNAGRPTDDDLIVIGYSMGGLVARYALADLEQRNIDHETGIYISLDAPHKGAHIPVSMQALALTFDSPSFTSAYPIVADQIKRFKSPAARQMLRYRITSATGPSQAVPVNTEHTAFLNEINGLNGNGGFPQNCQNFGVSLGSWSGTPQRANFDSDGDGRKDPQYSGFPVAYINFPASQNNAGSQAVWNLNGCQAVAAFSFQSYLSTAVANGYPYYSNRGSYLNLQDYNYSTYWYRNSTGTIVLPLGAWENIYAYENGEAIDFAPGGHSNTYQLLINGLNSLVQCSFSYYDNSSFIPTVSALAYNTTDLFHKIGDDADRLTKTPFDDIYAFCGENRSHINSQLTNSQLVQWIMNKVNGTSTAPCNCGSNALLTGPAAVCGSDVTFSLSSVPAGTTVNWSTSGNLTYVSGQGTANYVVRAPATTANGSGWVEAAITSNCGGTLFQRKNVVISSHLEGTYAQSNVTNTLYTVNFVKRNAPVTVTVSNYQSSTPFTWTLLNSGGQISWGTYNTSGSQMGFTITSGGGPSFRVRTTNVCGSAIMADYNFVVMNTPTAVSLSPNPTDDYLAVNVLSVDPAAPSSESSRAVAGNEVAVEYEVKIFNDRQVLVKEVSKTVSPALKIDIKDLPKGIYVVHIITSGETIKKKIIID